MESMLSGMDSERLYKHILKTESGKHLQYSPERMVARADYILMEFEGYERKTRWDAIKLKDTLSYEIRSTWSRTSAYEITMKTVVEWFKKQRMNRQTKEKSRKTKA